MTTTRHARVVPRSQVVLALAAMLVVGARDAVGDGERTAMYGLAVLGAEADRMPDQHAALAGIALDLAWWHGRFGLAAEGSALWTIDSQAHALVAGGSARLLLLETMVPSLLDPRDVELGVELQAIAERTWWSGNTSEANPTSYGFGLAFRFRGSGDHDSSTLLSESRFFLRVMSARWSVPDAIGRTMTPAASGPERALTVLIGIGASFGGGTGAYMDRFRLRPFDPTPL